MSDEFESAGAASVGSLKNDPQADPEGTDNGACHNCGADIEGRYCGNCGQLAANFHRPVWGLIADALGDFFALDGRLMRTLPALILRPGKVTREYLEGKRVSYVPPFRLYILSSLVFFFTLFYIADHAGWFEERRVNGPEAPRVNLSSNNGIINVDVNGDGDALSEEEIAGLEEVAGLARNNGLGPIASRLEHEIAAERARLAADQDEVKEEATTESDGAELEEEHLELLLPNGDVNREGITAELNERDAPQWTHNFTSQLANAYENQKLFYANVRDWTPRFALLLMPFMVLTFTAFYAFHRRLYVYDHVILTLHYQSWIYLFLVVLMIFTMIGVPGWIIWTAALMAPPAYLYRMQREAYAAGRILSFVRTGIFLFLSNLVIILLLLAALGAGVMDV